MENDLVKEQQGLGLYAAAGVIFFLEMMGTATLLFAIILSGLSGNAAQIPMTLFIILMVTGPITGGHINPGVSIATFTLRWRDAMGNLKWLALYWCAQLTGAFVGVGLASASLAHQDSKPSDYPKLGPNLGAANTGAAWFTEFYCSVLFFSVIMQVKEPRLHVHFKNTILILMAIAIGLMTAIYTGGSITGGCYNPAVAFGLFLMCSVHNPGEQCGEYLFLYMSASAVAGLFAGLFGLLLANWTTWLTPAGKKLVETPNTLFQSFTGSMHADGKTGLKTITADKLGASSDYQNVNVTDDNLTQDPML